MKDIKKRVFLFLDDHNGKSFVIDSKWNKDELYRRIMNLFNIDNVEYIKIKSNNAIIRSVDDILENDEILVESNGISNDLNTTTFSECQKLLNNITKQIDTVSFIRQIEKKFRHLMDDDEEEDSMPEINKNIDSWRQSEISIQSDSYEDIENDYWNSLITSSSCSPFNIHVVKEKHSPLLSNINSKIQKHRKILDKIKSSKIPAKAFIFDVEDNDDHVLYDTHTNKLLGCSIEKLIQKLTLDKFPDTCFVKTVLLTYILYLSPEDLLMYLTLRWKLTFKSNDKDKYSGIRLRIYSALKLWATYAPHDLMVLLKQQHDLFDEMEANGFGNVREELEKIISIKVERQLTASEENLIHDHYNQNHHRYSFNIENLIHFGEQITSINDIHPIDIANQITIIQKELFDSIHPREFLYGLNSTSDKEIFHSNIDRMIKFSNFLSDFTCTEILEKEDLSLRVITLNRFIHASKYCVDIGNYQGAYDIFSSLLRSPILGLKQTWNLLPKVTWDEVNKIKSLFFKDMDCSYFRNLLSATSCKVYVPLINMFIYDINQLDESSVLLKSNMINFSKMNSLSDILVSIFSYQENECNIIKDNDIISYIKCTKVYDERKMFLLSSKLEQNIQI